MERAPCHEKKPLRKGAWSPEEDRKLITYIKKYRIWNWSQMPGPAGLSRSGKSCRLRWMNYLRPDIKHGNFNREEGETILKLHEELGNKWSAIAARLPGRTDNEIKNYWHTHLKKRSKASLAPKTELQEAKTSRLEANQQNLSEIDLVLPNAPKSTNSEGSYATPLSSSTTSPSVLGELQSLWEQSFPIEDLYMVEHSNAQTATNSEDSYASPLSISRTSPAVYNDKNQALNEIIASSESLGEFQSIWEQPFPMKDLYMVEDYGAKYTDPGFIAPTSPMWLQEPIYPYAYYNNAGNDFCVNFFMQEYMNGI